MGVESVISILEIPESGQQKRHTGMMGKVLRSGCPLA
jgi:hypothetical protein